MPILFTVASCPTPNCKGREQIIVVQVSGERPPNEIYRYVCPACGQMLFSRAGSQTSDPDLPQNSIVGTALKAAYVPRRRQPKW